MAITAEQFERTMAGTSEQEQVSLNNPETPETPPAPPADQTPPPTQEKPTTEIPPATPPAAPFNLDEELVRITNGEIKTKADLENVLSRVKSLPEFETKVKTYEQENAELKARADANPFANDTLKKLNDLYKAGANESQIQAFQMLNKVPDLDALTPMQASTMALQMKHGLTEDQAKTYLSNKYGVDITDPEAKLDAVQEIQLKIDTAADKDYLKTYKAEVSTVPQDNSAKEQELLQAQNQQRIQQVQPLAENVFNETVANAFKSLNINGKTGDAAVMIDLPISDENKAALNEAVKNYVTNFNIQPNDEGKAAIASFVKNLAWIQNGEKWLIEAANLHEKQIRAEYHNPTGNIPRGEDNPEAGKTKEQKRNEGIMAALDL